MSRLMLMGAGGPIIASGPPLWNPGMEASLLAWFDLSDTGTYNTSTGVWTPRFGSGNLTKESVTPPLITNGLGGSYNALQFDLASNVGMAYSNPGTTSWVMVIVMKSTVGTGVNPVITSRAFLGLGVAGYQQYDFGGGHVRYAGTSNDAEWYSPSYPSTGITIARFSTSSRIGRYNGAQVGVNTVGNGGTAPGTTDSIRIFPSAGAQNAQYEVAAVAFLTSAGYTDALMEKIEGFIAHNNLGVSTAVLPGGHPYKTTPPGV